MLASIVCRGKVRGFALLVQDKAAKAGLDSPAQMAKRLDQDRSSKHKAVPEFVKQLLRERVQEKGTGNAAKGKRYKKAKPASAQEVPDGAGAS